MRLVYQLIILSSLFALRFIYLYFLFINVLPACTYVLCVNIWCSWVPEEVIVCPGTRVTNGCELLCWCWELNLDPLQEQNIILTTEPTFLSS